MIRIIFFVINFFVKIFNRFLLSSIHVDFSDLREEVVNEEIITDKKEVVNEVEVVNEELVTDKEEEVTDNEEIVNEEVITDKEELVTDKEEEEVVTDKKEIIKEEELVTDKEEEVTDKKEEEVVNITINPLKSIWLYWYHDNNFKESYTIDEFSLLYRIVTVEKYLNIYNYLPDIRYGHYYLMKQGIVPLLNSYENVNGFTVDLKFPLIDTENMEHLKEVFYIWYTISKLAVEERLFKNKTHSKYVNGVSISCFYKKSKFKFKISIWLRNKKHKHPKYFSPINFTTKFFSHVIEYENCDFIDNQNKLKYI
uniref:Uncharacterized protein n=1 Tax=viral metagenome TaxID=1070528 RepID=A0A6C0J595_9ZZZZ